MIASSPQGWYGESVPVSTLQEGDLIAHGTILAIHDYQSEGMTLRAIRYVGNARESVVIYSAENTIQVY